MARTTTASLKFSLLGEAFDPQTHKKINYLPNDGK